jgi:hypothetical protein
MLPVRIGETISAAHYQVGDSFLATLDRPLVVDGFIIAEKGSRLEGRVVEAEPAGRANSTSHLRIELVKLSTADGQHIQIRTEPYKKDAAHSAGNDAAKVGVGAVLGAAIGAVAGGGKGAAIGVGAGAAAGVAGVMLTPGKTAEIPVESRISFRIAGPVTITERLNCVWGLMESCAPIVNQIVNRRKTGGLATRRRMPSCPTPSTIVGWRVLGGISFFPFQRSRRYPLPGPRFPLPCVPRPARRIAKPIGHW